MERRSLPPFEDDFARALLRSAEHDEPPQTAYAKAAAALGVGVGIGVGASVPVAAAAAAAGAGRWGSPLATKLVAFAVSGLVLAGAGVVLLKAGVPGGGPAASARTPAAHAPATPPPPVLAAQPASAALVSPGASTLAGPGAQPAPASAPMAAASEVVDADAPGASVSSVAPHAAKPLGPARRSPSKALRANGASVGGAADSSLGEQVRSLDRARVALASGDANGALAELLHYRRSYPHGVFLTEASVLEVEAIAARGDRRLAAVRAAEFVAAHPDSPQAERLRALIPKKKP